MDSSRIQPVKLAYDIIEPSTGKKDGLSPILFLHGMTSTKEIWNHVSGPIADGTNRKVYRLDLRNHGDSEWSDVHDYHTMAKDVSNFMDIHSISKAVVIGHSMGGKVAMALALTEPEKVELVVIEDISPAYSSDLSKRYPFAYLKLLRESLKMISPEADEQKAKTQIYDFMRGKMPKDQTHPERNKFDPNVFQLRKTEKGYQWKANIDVLESRFFGPVSSGSKLQGHYSGKIIFIYGTRSTYNVIAQKTFIMEMFPNASFHAVEGATHLVHLEYPQEFIRACLDFME